MNAIDVARGLVGARIINKANGCSVIITETEAYLGEADTACHAHKGRNKRSEMLYRDGGTLFVYLCYGLHWLMNIVTGLENEPQGVLLRAGEGCKGPALLTRKLGVTGAHNGLSASGGDIEILRGAKCDIVTAPRVGIAYAAEADRLAALRFIYQAPPTIRR